MLSKQENRIILGKKVEALRKAKGMTQEELAKKAGFKGRASTNSIEKAHSGINPVCSTKENTCGYCVSGYDTCNR